MKIKDFKKIVYIIVGSITLALGTIGIFLPILPTTPLLLLTAFFYLRSSDKLYRWLMHHRIFGAYIYSYVTYKAVSFKTKVGAIAILWPSILFSIYLIDHGILKIMVFIIAIGVTIYIGSLQTLPKEKVLEMKKRHIEFREEALQSTN
ncbi:YbaN family protein [Paraliobacillus sp. X-1268]|uniref:YbaN family protein n=2 Tax=Paraliobacillus TaxID=200903 RepID=UPI000E3E406E|nr:YbaN family protein [Paraliobacillus sp. X-1268]